MQKDLVVIWDGGKIKQARVEAGYTEQDAVQLLGITKMHLTYLERGARQPSPRTITKISSLYRRPMSYFLIEKNFALA
jgi:transcriptional regulator with XRE-family HTH domain